MSPRRAAFLLATGLVAVSSLSLSALAVEGGGQVQSSAEVSNEEPANLRIEIDGDEDPGAPGVQISPSASGTTRISVRGLAEDGNGWRDLRKGTFTVTRPDGSTLVDAREGSAESEGRGRQRAFTLEFDLASTEPPGDYVLRLSVEDRHARAGETEAIVHIQEYLAFAIDQGAVSFGDAGLGPGATSHAAPAGLTVRNHGNVRIDLRITGAPLTNADGDASIGPERIRYGTTPDMAAERPLSQSGILDDAFDLSPGLTRNAYFDVHMPTGDEQYVPAGRYAGAITIGGVVG